MAITTQLLGSIGLVRGYVSNQASPNVTYKLPPAPYGWVAFARGSAVVTLNWVDLSTGQTVYSLEGNTAGVMVSTRVKAEAQQLATTVGIGVRFTSSSSIGIASIAPIGPDNNSYAMPPT